MNSLIQRSKSGTYVTYIKTFQTAYLLRGIMCPDKLLCRAEALVPQSHGSVDNILSIATHNNKPGAHKNAQMSDLFPLTETCYCIFTTALVNKDKHLWSSYLPLSENS